MRWTVRKKSQEGVNKTNQGVYDMRLTGNVFEFISGGMEDSERGCFWNAEEEAHLAKIFGVGRLTIGGIHNPPRDETSDDHFLGFHSVNTHIRTLISPNKLCFQGESSEEEWRGRQVSRSNQLGLNLGKTRIATEFGD